MWKKKKLNKTKQPTPIAQSAGAVEYTEFKTFPQWESWIWH